MPELAPCPWPALSAVRKIFHNTTHITAILPSESAAVPELAPCPWPALTHLSAVRKIFHYIYNTYNCYLPSESAAVPELAPCLSAVSAAALS